MKLCYLRGLIATILILLLSHCSQRKPIDLNDQVREPSEHSDSVIQVAPMVPEAVQLLVEEAEKLLGKDQVSDAILTLKRALSIGPGSALVQQHLAEVYLSNGQYQQAYTWSSLVVEQGPSHGPLCERARRTLALAAEMVNDVQTQAKALESIDSCKQMPAARY